MNSQLSSCSNDNVTVVFTNRHSPVQLHPRPKFLDIFKYIFQWTEKALGQRNK